MHTNSFPIEDRGCQVTYNSDGAFSQAETYAVPPMSFWVFIATNNMSKIHPAERAQYSLREVWLREQEMIGQVILSWAVQRPDMKWRFDLDSKIHLDNYLAVIMPFSVITHDFPFFSTTRLVMTT